MKSVCKIIFCLVLLFSAVNSLFAQTSDRDKGIELYKRGDSNIEAIKFLESASKEKTAKTDVEVWNYLGMAYLRQNRNKEAMDALEHAAKLNSANSAVHSNLAYLYLAEDKPGKARNESEAAIRLDPKNVGAYYIRGSVNQQEGKFEEAIRDAEQAVSISPDFISAYMLKSENLVNRFGKKQQNKGNSAANIDLLREAIKVLEICLQKCSQNNLQPVRENLEVISILPDYFSQKDFAESSSVSVPARSDSVKTDPNNTPLKIISKPRAAYTDAARSAQTQGTIKLAVVFGADGKVKRIFVIEGLGNGLSEQTINAAAKIIFEPERKNGKFVPVVKVIQYSFTIY